MSVRNVLYVLTKDLICEARLEVSVATVTVTGVSDVLWIVSVAPFSTLVKLFVLEETSVALFDELCEPTVNKASCALEIRSKDMLDFDVSRMNFPALPV